MVTKEEEERGEGENRTIHRGMPFFTAEEQTVPHTSNKNGT